MNEKREEIAANLLYWRHSPENFVKDLWKIDLDKWQENVLRCLGENKKIIRISLQSSAGTGKSAVLAWSSLWFLLVHGGKLNSPKGICFSLTNDNLQANLWTEIKKWLGSNQLLSSLFTVSSNRLYLKDDETHVLTARSFSQNASDEEKGRVLSGMHSNFPFFIMDETGNIPSSLLDTVEQAFGDANIIKGLAIQAGNPTSRSGMLYKATKRTHLWNCFEVTSDPKDPNRSTRISKAYAQSKIDELGRDNSWVQIFILGKFPAKSLQQLIGDDEFDASVSLNLRDGGKLAEVRAGIDVAREGGDETIIAIRHGLIVRTVIPVHIIDGDEFAAHLIHLRDLHGIEKFFIDDTGGYASSIVDSMIRLGEPLIRVKSNSTANDKERYVNRRSEMYFEFAKWLRRGGKLPNDMRLKEELTSIETHYKGNKLMLEGKDEIKKKIHRSPDRSDAIALTFALPELNKLTLVGRGSSIFEDFSKYPVKEENPLEYDEELDYVDMEK